MSSIVVAFRCRACRVNLTIGPCTPSSVAIADCPRCGDAGVVLRAHGATAVVARRYGETGYEIRLMEDKDDDQ